MGIIVSQRERMLSGALYEPFDRELVSDRRRARDLCAQLNASADADEAGRRHVLEALFGAGGHSVWVQPPFHCDYGRHIHLGHRIFFNFNCVVLDVCPVVVGDFTLIGPGVQILTAMHPEDAQLRRHQEFGRPITIGKDVWVGAGALILAGVTIGDRCIIGAGSVVTRDIPSDVVAVGNPCRVVRPLRSDSAHRSVSTG